MHHGAAAIDLTVLILLESHHHLIGSWDEETQKYGGSLLIRLEHHVSNPSRNSSFWWPYPLSFRMEDDAAAGPDSGPVSLIGGDEFTKLVQL